jgi:hypothetical protein
MARVRHHRGGGTMTRAEFVALASPPCHECDAAVQRVEARWHRDDDGEWRPGPWFMICGAGHRVLVKPLD